jgi:hypothetical protein
LQRWSFHLIPKKATINALVSIVLDPATKDSDFPLILYHKVCRVINEHCTIADETDRLNQDQANEKDYSHEGFGFSFKKTQADIVAKFMSSRKSSISRCARQSIRIGLGSSNRGLACQERQPRRETETDAS